MRPGVGTALMLESPVSLLTPPRFLPGWTPPSSLPTERDSRSPFRARLPALKDLASRDVQSGAEAGLCSVGKASDPALRGSQASRRPGAI